MIHNVPWNIFVDPKMLQKAFEFLPEDGDIIQISFPKCGSHWVEQITQLILNEGRSSANYLEFVDRAPFLEFQGEAAFRGRAAPRTVRTHLPFDKLHFNRKAKYIYVARSPWDCCVSCYHFVKALPAFGFQEGTFDDFIAAFLRGDWGFGDFFDHVRSGCDRACEPNVFVVTYEEIAQDTSGTVLKLARFLGEKYAQTLMDDADILQEVVYKSSVPFMKTILETRLDEVQALFMKNPNFSSTSLFIETEVSEPDSTRFNYVRKGKVGDWREHFSLEQLRRMQSTIEVKTKGSNIMSLWGL
ncbi:salivary sulfotransferase, putative [Ixodes scapularis]|uniref:Salivary sulfotransferase, putative n=1 Tax=Ixodes scapularis TaxID=6945 RepID=B7PG61_IXOSC|nr:salivary sulfotransferase, putative [Ixodes scapularis]|eukprot:XP_002434183.1 salivary sulfotransferase, putative [Ixodes scapularis]